MTYRHQQFETENGVFMKLSHEDSLPNDLIRLNQLGRIFFYKHDPAPKVETSLYLPDADEVFRFGNLEDHPELVEDSVFSESNRQSFVRRVSQIGHQIITANHLHSVFTRGMEGLSSEHQQVVIDISSHLQKSYQQAEADRNLPELKTGLYS